MIELVPDSVPEPTVDDLKVLAGGIVTAYAAEHPIALERFLGVVSARLLGEGYVWTCVLTGNGGAVDTREEALEALLLESLTEYPRTDRRPA